MTRDIPRGRKIRCIVLAISSLLLLVFCISCGQAGNLEEPPEIIYGQDVCDECSMIINEERFAASYVTKSGEVRRFDDIGGMLLYDQKHQEDVHIYWVHDLDTKEWVKVEEAHFVLSDELATPMGWGVAAFATPEQAEAYIFANGGVAANFASLLQDIADGKLDPASLNTHQHDQEIDEEMEHDQSSDHEGMKQDHNIMERI